jgi:hypothetical protein
MTLIYYIYLFFSPCAEASCRSAVDAARNVVADIGLASASSSGGLTELARCTDQNSERDCHRLITKKYALSLPVEKSVLETKDESRNIPVLKLTSWAQFLVRNNCWHVLCGLVKPDPRRERERGLVKVSSSMPTT